MRLRDFPSYLLVTLLMLYFIVLGGTYNGILSPATRLFSVVVLSGLTLLWAAQRRLKPAASTALDLALPIWGVAFGLSLIGNSDDWRRIVMGLWYIGAFTVFWYILHDVIARRVIPRQRLLDALLIVGAVVIYFGYLQLFNELANPNRAGLPRPVSSFGNPNTLASFLVMVIPFGFMRAVTGRRISRIVMALYTLLATGLLGVAFSRAGWVALGLMILVGGGVYLRSNRAAVRAWVASHRVITAAGGLISLAVIAAAGVILLNTLNDSSRSLDLRTFIYETAIRLFAQQPITGHGLFTFGGGLAELNSTPPTEPHSHAHNLFLHVGAELGIVGVIALVVTVYLVLRAACRNLQTPSPERPMIAAATLAILGFGANHLLDLPAMLPAVFITALLVMLVAVAPVASLPSRAPARPSLKPIVIFLGAAILIVSGVFESLVYSRYLEILSESGSGRFPAVTSADNLQAIIDHDPALMVYHQQQGLLYAAGGDYTQAAHAFARASDLAPAYTLNPVNQAAALAQLSQWDEAIRAQQIAIDRAPENPRLALALGVYAEAANDLTLARDSYARVLEALPDLPLWSWWNESPLRAELADEIPLSMEGEALQLLVSGESEAAQQRLDQARQSGANLPYAHYLDVFLALERGTPVSSSLLPAAWQQLYLARLRQLQNDEEGVQAALGVVGALDLRLTPNDQTLPNINYVQFLRMSLPTIWIDAAVMPPSEPLFVALYEWIAQARVGASRLSS